MHHPIEWSIFQSSMAPPEVFYPSKTWSQLINSCSILAASNPRPGPWSTKSAATPKISRPSLDTSSQSEGCLTRRAGYLCWKIQRPQNLVDVEIFPGVCSAKVDYVEIVVVVASSCAAHVDRFHCVMKEHSAIQRSYAVMS